MKDDFIRPITKLKINQCLKCQSVLDIEEVEVNKITIGDTGIPIDYSNKFLKTRCICSNCGANYIVSKTGMYNIPCTTYILDELAAAKKIKEAEEDLFKNPFGRY